MLYWLALPHYLRRDREAVVRETSNASAIVSTFFPMHWAGNIAAARWGIRHAHLCFEPFPFFHDPEVKAAYPLPKRALLEYLSAAYGRVDRKGILGADRLLTLNRASAGSIERVYGRTDAKPTYAGVDTEFFHPYSDQELADLRERHGDGPFAIHSTDFSPIKRTDLALRAFAAAQRSLPNGHAKLLVTSTREDRSGLAQMWDLARSLSIEDRVEFLGFVPYEDLPRYYSVADVLIQSGTAAVTGATAMSLPVKEALACGTAVIRADVTDEDVEDGVSGYLVDPVNSEATGVKLAALLGDRARAREMGEAGRGKITELYRWDRVVDIVLGAVS
jgi:glycosyltransferase involved in cell wall biosynthesis